MKTLFVGGKVLNVFTDTFEDKNVLAENGKIIGVGDYDPSEADEVIDVSGKWLAPGFVDGHIHIESTMLTPAELAGLCVAHGTTAIVADPHEIANVCGVDGIRYMLKMSEGLPMEVFVMLPSCVPATPFDEAGAVLKAEDLEPLYSEERVLGLAEMMNYPGIIYNDPDTIEKVNRARALGKVINGHAPLLGGKDLDKYISAGISDDHECSSADEGKERIEKGQWIMIRQGTAAHNLEGLLPLFEDPYNRRCLLVTDDKHPADLLSGGHIDNIIRLAIGLGQKPEVAIRMATIQAAQCFRLPWVGALAPGYQADIVVIDDLKGFTVSDVYAKGKMVSKNGKALDFAVPRADKELEDKVRNTFRTGDLSADSFHIEPKGDKCRVISIIPGQLITEEKIYDMNWDENNGISIEKDLLKLAVVERHHKTGHIGLGFIHGIGLKKGAIASTVSHDSHNLIIVGTSDEEMYAAAMAVKEMGGGSVVVCDGQVLAKMPLPIAGLMTDLKAEEIAADNEALRTAVHKIGANDSVEPFMMTAFVSLPVIPALKMSTQGLVDVTQFKRVELFL